MTGPSAAARLQRLRRTLVLLVLCVSAVGLGALALVATLVDSSLRADEADTERQGLASRAAALVFFDTDRWNVEGVQDDVVFAASDAIVILLTSDTLLFESEAVTDYESLAQLGFADGAEVGALGSLRLADGTVVQAAAAPFFDDDGVAGAVLVGLAESPNNDHRRLVLFVWGSAALLTFFSVGVAWSVSGRVVEPMGKNLDREEAFLATAAHELRTPLGRIRAVADSAGSTARSLPETPTKTQLGRELRRLVVVIDQATDVVNDLLLVGRIDAEHLEMRRGPVRLDQVLAGFEATMPGLAVDTSGPVVIDGDATLVRHAISNLLANAVRHGTPDEAAPLVEASVRIDGGDAVIVVSDNGPGVNPSEVEALFDRYRSDDGGSGLGLWIVRSIMDAHGGTVEVIDVEQPGATFCLRWPSASTQ